MQTHSTFIYKPAPFDADITSMSYDMDFLDEALMNELYPASDNSIDAQQLEHHPPRNRLLLLLLGMQFRNLIKAISIHNTSHPKTTIPISTNPSLPFWRPVSLNLFPILNPH